MRGIVLDIADQIMQSSTIEHITLQNILLAFLSYKSRKDEIFLDGYYYGTLPVNNSLLTGTLPVNKSLLTGTVPANNFLLTGTVPVNNSLLTGTFPVNKSLLTGTLQVDNSL